MDDRKGVSRCLGTRVRECMIVEIFSDWLDSALSFLEIFETRGLFNL